MILSYSLEDLIFFSLAVRVDDGPLASNFNLPLFPGCSPYSWVRALLGMQLKTYCIFRGRSSLRDFDYGLCLLVLSYCPHLCFALLHHSWHLLFAILASYSIHSQLKMLGETAYRISGSCFYSFLHWGMWPLKSQKPRLTLSQICLSSPVKLT